MYIVVPTRKKINVKFFSERMLLKKKTAGPYLALTDFFTKILNRIRRLFRINSGAAGLALRLPFNNNLQLIGFTSLRIPALEKFNA